MKRVFILTCCLLLSCMSSFSQDKLPETFADLLARAKMSFTTPKDYVETVIVENPHMNYDYAVKHPTEKFEVRYAVRPMDIQLRDYEKLIADGATAIHPNNRFSSTVTATFLNIGGDMPDLGAFPDEAVKEEFNADKGVTGICEARREFAGEYKYCMMVSLFRENMGTAFIFYMADDPAKIMEQIPLVFHALIFE